MLRDEFPEAGSDYLGGSSDGWEYRTVFAGGSLDRSFEMVRQFLIDEGLGDIPIPASADELRLFRLPKNRQTFLFLENGYVHNPIKILFPPVGQRARAALILCVYNPAIEGHLLRFHGRNLNASH